MCRRVSAAAISAGARWESSGPAPLPNQLRDIVLQGDGGEVDRRVVVARRHAGVVVALLQRLQGHLPLRSIVAAPDRKSVVKGKTVSVRVDLGGGVIIKKQTNINIH